MRSLWGNAGSDPKSGDGNVTVSNTVTLPGSGTQTLLDVFGPRCISSIKLRVPGLEPQAPPPVVTDNGRAHQGYSQFRMVLQPANAGAILRRRLDQGIANQQAALYVDGSFVGLWYGAGSNPSHRWRDDEVMIPASYTRGKSSILIKLQFVSSTVDWNEFSYSIYMATSPVVAVSPRLADPHSSGSVGSRVFQFDFSGTPNATYDVWASTNLSVWQWLGTANESSPGQYGFTDQVSGLSQRFYRVYAP